jgi:flagellin
MALQINTNMGALMASSAASSVNKMMETSMNRLSTGMRINTAADDAAGVAIAGRMTSNINGLNQAIRNASDGQAMIDTAEGAHSEIVNILQRMRDISVQSANDTNTTDDRGYLQSEMSQLKSELDRISQSTSWAGQKLLDGNFASKTLQIGSTASTSEQINIGIDSMAAGSMGTYRLDSNSNVTVPGDAVAALTQTVTDFDVIGHKGAAEAAFTAASSAATVAAAVNADTGSTGVSASAVTNAKLALSATPTSTVSFGLNGTAISATVVSNTDLTNLRDAMNAVSGTTGVTATFDGTNKAALLITDANGDNIAITDFSDTGTATTLNVTARNYDNSADNGAAKTMTSAATGVKDTVILGTVRFESIKAFTVLDQEAVDADNNAAATAYLTSASNAATLSSVSALDIGTQTGAENALGVIDGAIGYVMNSRANLGAISNRLDSTVSNLTNIVTNTEGARSRVQDADFAAESTNLAKAQILQQASTAMLAQANASKQGVLQLLQG